MKEFSFEGCNNTNFGSYLKGLGIFRILGKKYTDAKAYWENNLLYISLPFNSYDEIADFFLNKYEPTPIVSPWNNGSGFKKPKKELNDLKNYDQTDSNYPRLKNYIDVIIKTESIVKSKAINKNLTDKEKKSEIVRLCRNFLPEETVKWIDAALILDNNGTVNFTKILTTGGNEGNLDYSITYMADIYEVFKSKNSTNLLENSLFNCFTDQLIQSKVGKFIPGKAGGFNEGFGFENKDFNANPWDFIFSLEGTLFFSTGLGKKSISSGSFIRSPFTVGSTIDIQGKKRGYEIWTPLWKNPAYLYEIEKMFENGRVEISNSPVAKGVEFIQAIKNYGVDRGIYKFIRYELLNTRGKAGYVATPVDSYNVKYVKNVNVIKEINTLLSRLDSYIYNTINIPATLPRLKRKIDDSLFYILKHDISIGMEELFYNIGKMEKYLATIKHDGVPLIGGLSPEWLNLNSNPSNEFVIAAAISSIYHIRKYIEPVNYKDNILMKWDDEMNYFSFRGSNIYRKLANVLYRVYIENETKSEKYNTLNSRIKIGPEYATLLINDDINEDKMEHLLYGFMWIDWNKNKDFSMSNPEIDNIIYTEYATVKLLYLNNKIRPLYVNDKINDDGIALKGNPEIIGMLEANNIEGAYKMAYNAIKSKNIDIIRQRHFNNISGERLAASLVLPVRYKKLVRLLLQNYNKEVVK